MTIMFRSRSLLKEAEFLFGTIISTISARPFFAIAQKPQSRNNEVISMNVMVRFSLRVVRNRPGLALAAMLVVDSLVYVFTVTNPAISRVF
jgi:hypothetical protein